MLLPYNETLGLIMSNLAVRCSQEAQNGVKIEAVSTQPQTAWLQWQCIVIDESP